MVDSLTLPEKTRAAMAETYLELQKADVEVKRIQASFQKQVIIACDFLGLDPTLNHQINFETGVITPAEPLTKPERVTPQQEAS